MTDLDRACALLRQDRPIPLDLAARLMADGIDVEKLEDFHSDHNEAQVLHDGR